MPGVKLLLLLLFCEAQTRKSARESNEASAPGATTTCDYIQGYANICDCLWGSSSICDFRWGYTNLCDCL